MPILISGKCFHSPSGKYVKRFLEGQKASNSSNAWSSLLTLMSSLICSTTDSISLLSCLIFLVAIVGCFIIGYRMFVVYQFTICLVKLLHSDVNLLFQAW